MAYRLQLKSRVVLRDGASVNESAPRSYRGKHATCGHAEKRIRVVYPSGRLAYTVSYDTGYSMHRGGLGNGIFTRKGKLICVKLTSGPDTIKDGTRYVTNSETDTNVSNVYSFIPILGIPREVFRQVQTSVLVAA